MSTPFSQTIVDKADFATVSQYKYLQLTHPSERHEICPGVRAVRIHRSLPQASQSLHASSVSICRDVAYSNKQRTVMDIYIPSHHAASPQSSNCNDSQPNAKELGPTEHPVNSVVDAQAGSVQRQLPVALFCHGGVWATGQPICLFCPLCLTGQATSMLAIDAIVL